MIPEIRINNIGVGNVGIGDVQSIGIRSPQTIRVADNRIWVVNPPNATLLEPPVVVQVGTPIVNIAGCVELHKENTKGNRNKQLVDNDPKGNTVLCDAGAPSFRAIDYQANRLKWETFYGDPPEADGVKTNPPPPTTPPGTIIPHSHTLARPIFKEDGATSSETPSSASQDSNAASQNLSPTSPSSPDNDSSESQIELGGKVSSQASSGWLRWPFSRQASPPSEEDQPAALLGGPIQLPPSQSLP